jgi:hypothetical protein
LLTSLTGDLPGMYNIFYQGTAASENELLAAVIGGLLTTFMVISSYVYCD